MKRILPAALVLVVLALIAGHVFLGATVFRLYRAYNALRLDPLGLRSAPLPPSGHYDILLMGDSLAEQWTFPEGSVANAGRHAQTSAQILLRMQRLDADLHADLFLLSAGGNDLKTLRTDPDCAPVIIQSALANLREILRLAHRHSPRIHVLTIPPIPSVPLHLRPFKSTRVMLDALDALNAGIREVAAEEGAAAIDCQRVFEGLDPADIHASDGLHLSETAYERLRDHLRANQPGAAP
ncbi:MAG: SGNH/GDSL hydrolase family protein [Lentisphaerae bacterium]|nr:SGNH/GDSL hydrolase family protein [Lentisphaerota bacterium]